jgi:hypothetical protein
MKAFRRLALVALVLVSAVVVVASPAFATPRLTSSTGTRPDGGASTPYITPIGDTLTRSITITFSSRPGARAGSSLTMRTLGGLTDGLTCIRLTISGWVTTTHTTISIDSISFLGCREDNVGLRIDIVVNHSSSSNPYFIHFTGVPAANSTTGKFLIPAGSSIDLFIKNAGVDVCQAQVQPQSVAGVTLTDRNRLISVASGPTIEYSLPNAAGGAACPDPRARGTQTAVTAIPYISDDGTAYVATVLSR